MKPKMAPVSVTGTVHFYQLDLQARATSIQTTRRPTLNSCSIHCKFVMPRPVPCSTVHEGAHMASGAFTEFTESFRGDDSEARFMSHDTWIHRGARVLARPLSRTRATPNHVTSARLITGIAAAAMFALGEEHLRWWALLLFMISMLCDRLDGELARLTGRSSRWGHRYDQITDTTCNSMLFVGIGVGELQGPLAAWAGILGVGSGGFIAIILYQVVQHEDRAGDTISFRLIAGFDPDDFIVLAPLAAALGWGTPLLMVATVCVPMAALYIHFKLRERAPPIRLRSSEDVSN